MRAIPVFGLLVALTLPAVAGPVPDEPTKEVRVTAQAVNAFAARLYAPLAGGDGNLVFSPYSLHAGLTRLLEGARGATRDELVALLSPGGEGAGPTHAGLRAWLEGQEGNGFELRAAASVWADRTLDVAPAFAAGGLRRLDFTDGGAARTALNAWAREATAGKVDNVVGRWAPPPATRVAVTSALYLKAAWMNPFRIEDTEPAPFHRADGSQVNVPMMAEEEYRDFADVDGMKLLALPCGTSGVQAVFVLPPADRALETVEAKFAEDGLAAALGQLKFTRVRTRLPRFRIDRGFELTAAIKELGVATAFDPGEADFTGIADERPLSLGPVLHRTFLAVDERGIEGGSCTVMFGVGGMTDPITFVADRPFLFLVRDSATGVILFLGLVMDPSRP